MLGTEPWKVLVSLCRFLKCMYFSHILVVIFMVRTFPPAVIVSLIGFIQNLFLTGFTELEWIEGLVTCFSSNRKGTWGREQQEWECSWNSFPLRLCCPETLLHKADGPHWFWKKRHPLLPTLHAFPLFRFPCVLFQHLSSFTRPLERSASFNWSLDVRLG